MSFVLPLVAKAGRARSYGAKSMVLWGEEHGLWRAEVRFSEGKGVGFSDKLAGATAWASVASLRGRRRVLRWQACEGDGVGCGDNLAVGC